jgi:hypothetical protein
VESLLVAPRRAADGRVGSCGSEASARGWAIGLARRSMFQGPGSLDEGKLVGELPEHKQALVDAYKAVRAQVALELWGESECHALWTGPLSRSPSRLRLPKSSPKARKAQTDHQRRSDASGVSSVWMCTAMRP